MQTAKNSSETNADEDAKTNSSERAVVFISHLPRGFFERQLYSYFSQFGKVTRLKLPRSNKTGNCKGYAFVEFADKDVAKIAAETMDGYLMFEHILKCVVMDEPPRRGTFKGWNKYKRIKSIKFKQKMYNRERSELQTMRNAANYEMRVQAKQSLLKQLGVNLDVKEISKQIETMYKKE